MALSNDDAADVASGLLLNSVQQVRVLESNLSDSTFDPTLAALAIQRAKQSAVALRQLLKLLLP